MPFERLSHAPRRIAVIGGGISGMAAAHLLAQDHAVVLFEAEHRLGGHARTVMAGKRGDQPVDTGFIVFNEVNYPRLSGLFKQLDVPVIESNMSFGASFGGGRLEYGLASCSALFAQPRNALDPRFLGMLRDILRFNAKAVELAKDEATSLGDFLRELRTGDWFRDHYLLPFSGAIWSTPAEAMLSFPARALVQFFRNHNLLAVTGQHQWFTVKGGSAEYVRRLQAAMQAQGVDLRLGAAVAGVRRSALGLSVRVTGSDWEPFDEVVFACHSDQTLRLLADVTPEERASLSAIRYQPNEAVLHSDASVMPQRRAVWSSWSYVEPAGQRPEKIALSYWMNVLQSIPQDDPLFVTLNGQTPIRDALIHDVTTFWHPVFDRGTLAAQEKLRRMNGQRGTWFCGAWMRNGFHEDGFASAVDVVESLCGADRGAVREDRAVSPDISGRVLA